MLILANSNQGLMLMEHFKVCKALVPYFTFKFTSVLLSLNRSGNVPHSAVCLRNTVLAWAPLQNCSFCHNKCIRCFFFMALPAWD